MDKYQSTFTTYHQLALAYEEKFMDFDLYNDTYQKFCDLLPPQKTSVLEVGCGPGNITKFILGKKPLCKVFAIDMAPAMLELAAKNNPSATFRLMDCRNIHQLQQTFDAIVCGFCLPYLDREDCIKFIRDSYNLLNENGIIYLSAIEGNYNDSKFEFSSNGEHKTFVYYYGATFLKNQLVQNKFELIEMIRKKYPVVNPTSTHLILIAKKQGKSS